MMARFCVWPRQKYRLRELASERANTFHKWKKKTNFNNKENIKLGVCINPLKIYLYVALYMCGHILKGVLLNCFHYTLLLFK